MDALSDVLRAVRLTGAVFFDVPASAPWVAESPPGRFDRRRDLPRRRASDLLPRRHRRGAAGDRLIGEPPIHSRPATSSCFRTAMPT